ncbi:MULTISPECIES: CHAT domain-containing protein [Bizionia]|uniref:CHAT domain-containing protein n=1 Tax=Bizionia algoritergicola TaxID=291187 RepID=A0A5D0QTZ4_9FLAO|nr:MULTISPECIES: CHAT domain-containing protein [Bizionia]OBX21982.1 hypothetical protein BAA08_10495 [Bizionia sp. APA-3]TYB72286.1 CHAT domain-containing protein [Bizionia algoritergicola]
MIITKRLYLIPIYLLSLVVNAQTIDDLIQYNKENLTDLYGKRGAPADWLFTGHVNEMYLIDALNSYEDEVGIIIYSHQNNELTISLINKKGILQSVKHTISKDTIIEQVNDVNQLFSSNLSSQIPSFRGSISTNLKKSTKVTEKAYRNLNTILLPNEWQLEDYDHLIIVPTLNLSTLPFAAFKMGETFLIDKMSFSIAPSLFEFMVSTNINYNDAQSNNDGYNWTNALFVANPKYPKTTDWQFPDLPGTVEEINYITRSLQQETFTILTAENATKHAVMDNICNYDLLYFATHGISDATNPLDNSFLVLAEGENNTAFLTAKEIMNLRQKCMLQADLVVLSACQTGIGASHDGGIIGMARSFQIAGANHVLMSLWSINDKETATLMGFFFDFLNQSGRLQPHEALRQAILKYKSEVNNDPKYWAAFSIFGVPY